MTSTSGPDVKQIKLHVEDTNANVQRIAEEKTDEALRYLLSPPNVTKNYEDALEQRHDGTGDWFLQSEIFTEWKNNPDSILWLHGMPGCGKTILSASIMEHLQQEAESSSKTVLYFFFTFSDESKRSARSMVCSFIFRLYHKFKQHSSKHVKRLLDRCKDGYLPGLSFLLDTLRSILDAIEDDVIFVLDALDECGTLDDLIPWLRRLHGRTAKDETAKVENAKQFRVIITSRPEERLEAQFREWGEQERIIGLEEHLVNKDIHAFVWKSLQETDPVSNPKYFQLAERMRYWEEDRESISDQLANKAASM